MNRNYHHGNLKETLFDVAQNLIAQNGHADFTLADAAKIAGVSSAAPYRHFASKEELMLELMKRGLNQLIKNIQSVSEDNINPYHKLSAIGNIFTNFMCERRGEYIVIFEYKIEREAKTEIDKLTSAAFMIFCNVLNEVLEDLPPEMRPPTPMVAIHIWSMAHGIYYLETHNTLPRYIEMNPALLLENGVRLYLHGLGLEVPESTPHLQDTKAPLFAKS